MPRTCFLFRGIVKYSPIYSTGADTHGRHSPRIVIRLDG